MVQRWHTFLVTVYLPSSPSNSTGPSPLFFPFSFKNNCEMLEIHTGRYTNEQTSLLCSTLSNKQASHFCIGKIDSKDLNNLPERTEPLLACVGKRKIWPSWKGFLYFFMVLKFDSQDMWTFKSLKTCYLFIPLYKQHLSNPVDRNLLFIDWINELLFSKHSPGTCYYMPGSVVGNSETHSSRLHWDDMIG